MRNQTIALGMAVLTMVASPGRPVLADINVPEIKAISRPAAGVTEIIFHGPPGPFQVQTRSSMDPAVPWVDMPDAVVTELKPGVYLGQFKNGRDDLGFYRVVSQKDGIAALKGWTVMVQVSTPANGSFFVPGETPLVTLSLLDTFGQGVVRTDLSTFNLYMYGPQDPAKTVTAAKLLNASTDRTAKVHHYVDLRSNPDVLVNGSQITYRLKPVTDELPGTYTVSVWSVLASDPVQQIMKFATIQIGTTTVENSMITDASGVASCASCHLGPVSGRMYMHHIDPGYSPTGNWSLDFTPAQSCKSCHNNNGYSAYSDASVAGGKVADPLVRRVHGVHMGEGLKLAFNTNSVNGDFKDYTDLAFPADVRNCTSCHQAGDARWEQRYSVKACSTCHDNIWFGPGDVPSGMKLHTGGLQLVNDDKYCIVCHGEPGVARDIIQAHTVAPPATNAIDIALSAPANGKFFVAGEKPVVNLVIKDDSGKPIDHTKVTDGNFSTASLFVYGPRSETVPVLTSTAKYVNAKLRASVSSSIAGPWAINGKVFKIAINGSAAQNITIVGTSNLVTAAQVVASLNAVITNLNGGAIATVSGANVNIKTLIQGDQARIAIYNGDVTTAMGWKRAPNTIMEPDVTVAAGYTPSNDLRALSDPLDFSDPMVTRTTTNISYQLDDVAALAPGSYGVYAYQLPKAGKIAGMTNLVGLGQMMFQVGTATAEKKIATNCQDCHGKTIFHLDSGPIHPAKFDTDYCKACHDYGHSSTGDMFKNQGGTSLNGWSGYGAVPVVRRVHGIHFAHYLDHSEEIYANATKTTFSGIIFPQDVRNCTKCHSETDAWKQEPSRLACLACHDSDTAKNHAKMMTYVPDPTDPYGPLSVETCVICHGVDAEFSADKVHNISSPYVPPYPRNP